MSQPERFLERWSRRKREAADPPPESEAKENKKNKTNKTNKTDADPAPAAEEEKPFDLDSLPSLESIGADTDMRDFLRPDVPEELRNEALRRAWAADPGVRDFVELLENGWDFNDPNAMAGFGPIAPDEVARLMAQFKLPELEEAPPEADKQSLSTLAASKDALAPPDDVTATSDDSTDQAENAAAQNELGDSGPTTLPTEREPS
jgi:hypothetical protein